MRRQVVGVQNLGQFAMVVFHSVTLVDDHVLPLQFCKHSLVLDNILVSREKYVEFSGSHLGLNGPSASWGTLVGNHDHTWGPLFELQDPVGKCTESEKSS